MERIELAIMHSYLPAVGFSQLNTKSQIEALLREVMEDPDAQNVIQCREGESIIEIRKEYGEGFGICLYGTLDDQEMLDIEYYFPYLTGEFWQKDEDIIIEKHIANSSFAGACDDLSVGVSLIFYLQNGMEYLEKMVQNKTLKKRMGVSFSALSLSGTILLPIRKTEKEIRRNKVAIQNRKKLIENARKGDEEAIESLTLEDLDTYTQVCRRIMYEDVFTIVDNCFMPYGIECDLYTVVGDILAVQLLENKKTKEEIYHIILDYNDWKFNIAINKSHIVGEPAVGRRFKGTIWLQGMVEF